MTRHFSVLFVGLLGAAGVAAQTMPSSLIVVEDRGGVSALPYYQALNLLPERDAPAGASGVRAPAGQPGHAVSEADMLPVRSVLLAPGHVMPRVIHAPGLRPLFIVGDDAESRTWLQQHRDRLDSLGAAGLVVNVATAPALAALRQLVPGLTLVPASGDDLARRLGLRHYPALITATGIEP